MTSTIISKVWSFANVMRDDGMGYGDYLEQLTYLLFLKMADEYAKPPFNTKINIPENCNWESIKDKRGTELENHYITVLRELGKQPGILGQIFTKSQNKIQDPAKLKRLVNLIDSETWVMMSSDVKGDIYEGLLQKYAEDTKSGAGQYFTPRPLIRTMVRCMDPEPKKSIADPACGTGGFFLAAYDYLEKKKLDKDQKKFLKHHTFKGNEIVPGTRRMGLMNLFLHNIGEITDESIISVEDSLLSDTGERFDYVLTNPPFGKKSSMTFTNKEGKQETEKLVYNRNDFWATSSNKQLNFVQHIHTMLKADGKAAVVLPDNVLFEGGAGETVRKKLLETTDLHTILRLPTGIFYKPGVKANVLFFDNKHARKEPWTKEVWFYDLRTNKHFTLKENPMKDSDLEEFVQCYNPQNRFKRTETWAEDNPEGRWRKFSYDEIVNRDKTSLDIFWIKDKSLADMDNLPDPDILANDIIENIESSLHAFKEVMEDLNQNAK
jgi:type I restriction enzyme M protein